MFLRCSIIVLVILFLTACGGDSGSGNGGSLGTTANLEQKAAARINAAEKAVKNLKTNIDQNQLRNAAILKEYTNALRTQKPELNSLISNLARDATSEGALFKNLELRLSTLKSSPELFETAAEQYAEANAIIKAAKPINFDQALTDVINVVADMSGGMLPRINTLSKEQSLQENRAEDLGAGSQLIGNPAYGQWVNQGGMSVWEWYGMFALFRDLVGGRSYSYGHWDRHRDWSHYSDVGRNKYGDYRARNTNPPKTNKYRTERGYGSNKKSYGGGSRERAQSTFSKASQQKSTSSSKKASGFGGSFRNKSSFSRGGFGGK